MTKKAAALLLAASLAVSVCATPVFAAGNPPVQNGQGVQDELTGENIANPANGKKACTKLTYTVTEGYTWSIPADITFTPNHGVTDADQTSSGKVTIKNCKLKNDYTLRIAIAGNGGQYDMNTTGGFKVKTVEGAELPYTVDKAGAHTLANGDEVLSLAAGKNQAEADLTFTLKTHTTDTNAAEKAGEYIGYAVFTAQATKN